MCCLVCVGHTEEHSVECQILLYYNLLSKKILNFTTRVFPASCLSHVGNQFGFHLLFSLNLHLSRCLSLSVYMSFLIKVSHLTKLWISAICSPCSQIARNRDGAEIKWQTHKERGRRKIGRRTRERQGDRRENKVERKRARNCRERNWYKRSMMTINLFSLWQLSVSYWKVTSLSRCHMMLN